MVASDLSIILHARYIPKRLPQHQLHLPVNAWSSVLGFSKCVGLHRVQPEVLRIEI